MKDAPVETTPPGVAVKPSQGGEIHGRWSWVEPTVWTERMLAALETGIEGGKWFRLIDKVWSAKNLVLSVEKVIGNGGSAGIDGQSTVQMGRHKENEVRRLQKELEEDSYRPQAVKRVWITEAGKQ